MEFLTSEMDLLDKPAFQELSYTGKILAPKVMVQVGFAPPEHQGRRERLGRTLPQGLREPHNIQCFKVWRPHKVDQQSFP